MLSEIFGALVQVPAILLLIAGLLLVETGISGRSLWRRFSGNASNKMRWLMRLSIVLAGLAAAAGGLALLATSG